MILAVVMIVLALVLVGGSIFWLLPSPAERRRMHLRERTLAQGVRVREAREEMKEWGIDPRDLGMLMQYHLYMPESKAGRWRLVNPDPVVQLQVPEQEQSRVKAGIEGSWSELPADLVVWERRDQRYGFYWFERGDQAQLDRALDMLKRVAEGL